MQEMQEQEKSAGAQKKCRSTEKVQVIQELYGWPIEVFFTEYLCYLFKK